MKPNEVISFDRAGGKNAGYNTIDSVKKMQQKALW
jgi:hypothetical protein